MKNCNASLLNSRIPCVIRDGYFYVLNEDATTMTIADWFATEEGSSGEDYYDNRVEGKVIIFANDKYGFADLKSGKIISEPQWDFVSYFHSGYAIVRRGGHSVSRCYVSMEMDNADNCGAKYSLINLEGEAVLPVIYDWMSRTKEDNYIVSKDNKFGCISASGDVIVPLKYDQLYECRDSFCVYEKNRDGFGLLTKDGEEVFSDADGIYLCRSFQIDSKYHCNITEYFIARRKRKYAICCADGRMLFDFSFLFRDAKVIVNELMPKGVKISPWQIVKSHEIP